MVPHFQPVTDPLQQIQGDRTSLKKNFVSLQCLIFQIAAEPFPNVPGGITTDDAGHTVSGNYGRYLN